MSIFYDKTWISGVGQIWWKCHIVTEIEEQVLYKSYSPSKGWIYRTMSRFSLDYGIELGLYSLNEKDGEKVS